MSKIISAKALCKSHRGRMVVSSADLDVHGEIVGLLGPNGAGTTTFCMIVGLDQAGFGFL